MKKLGLLVALTFVAGISLSAQNPDQTYDLPELHTIKTATLGPAYSCRPEHEFQRGYEKTALFLSAALKQRNTPDLVFNGACGSEDYFQASTAGDDFSLIADLGENVTLELVSASRAFNLTRVHSYADYSKFTKAAKVKANHTYAVLLNGSEKRGLFIFTVVNYVPNAKVDLKYAVKSYQVMPGRQFVAAGFDWEKVNN